MSKFFPLFTSTYGLNTVLGGHEFVYNEDGIKYLSQAINVEVTGAGKIKRRSGYLNRLSGSYHSAFKHRNLSVIVGGKNLYSVAEDLSLATVYDDLTAGLTLDYTGVNEEIYYTNSKEIGIVSKDAAHKSWAHLSTHGLPDDRVYSQPPVGHLLTYLAGRIYVAKDNAVYPSEPFFYSAFDLARGFLFPSRIRFLRAIPNGLFVGTEAEIFFLKGTNPKEMEQSRVADYPALICRGCDNTIEGKCLLDGKTFYGDCIIIPTTEGICVGGATETGYFQNVTHDRVTYPDALYASLVINKDKMFISTW